MTPKRHARSLAGGLVAILAATGCGVSDEPSGLPVVDLPAAQEATTTVAATSTTSTATSTTIALPGDPFDPIYAQTGAVLDAIGIAFDETLDLRVLPGSSETVIASLPPLSGDIVSEGRARLLENDGIWLEVTAAGTTGWTRSNRLAYLGGVRDVTSEVVTAAGGTPTAPSMLELGDIVNDIVVPSDPAAPPAEIIVAAAPTPTATSEVVYDTFPGEFFGDDTAIGSRVVVVGRQVTGVSLPPTGFAPGVVYELVRVDVISFCTRGVTSDGLCV